MFLIFGLFVYFRYTFVFDPRVGRYEKSKMFFFFHYSYSHRVRSCVLTMCCDGGHLGFMIDTKNVRDNLFHHSLYNLEFLVSVENLFSLICIFGNTSSKLQISDKIEICSTLTKLQFKYQLILFYICTCIVCTHALNS